MWLRFKNRNKQQRVEKNFIRHNHQMNELRKRLETAKL